MKEMRLFEVGFKEKPESLGYTEKFYVAADDYLPAVSKARLHIVEEANHWWESGGREENIFSAYNEDTAGSRMSDAEILASEKYQKAAEKDFDVEINQLKNLYLAKVLDIGTLIV